VAFIVGVEDKTRSSKSLSSTILAFGLLLCGGGRVMAFGSGSQLAASAWSNHFEIVGKDWASVSLNPCRV